MFRFPSLDLIRASALVALAASMVLGTLGLQNALRDKRKADEAFIELRLFEQAAAAATAITAERRPLELALSLEPEQSLAILSELRGARLSTDIEIRRFREQVSAAGEGEGMNFSFLETTLRNERLGADTILSLPLAERQVGLQLRVTRGMSAISESFVPFVDKSARRVIAADENLSGRVNMVRLLGALYEAAMRLPSEVMPALKRSEVLPPEARMSSMRVQQRILALWDIGISQLEFGIASDDLRRALEDIRATYFGRGFPFLVRAIETYSRRPMKASESGSGIARVYIPTTVPIAHLRDQYVRAMMADAVATQTSAMRQVSLMLGLSGLILVMTVIAACTVYRQILGPLLSLRDQILAACDNRLFERKPYHGSVQAIRNLFRALEMLELRDKERMALDSERAALSERLRALSETDELTGLPNRRGFFGALGAFGGQAGEYVAILGDIDHFKTVNDTHGHDVGDEVLVAFAACIRERIGAHVVAARYGGEEFAMAVRADRLETILAFAEALRAEIEGFEIRTAGASIRITASFGLAHQSGPVTSWNTLLTHADKALYEAKSAGRNRVRLINGTLATLTTDRRQADRREARQVSG